MDGFLGPVCRRDVTPKTMSGGMVMDNRQHE